MSGRCAGNLWRGHEPTREPESAVRRVTAVVADKPGLPCGLVFFDNSRGVVLDVLEPPDAQGNPLGADADGPGWRCAWADPMGPHAFYCKRKNLHNSKRHVVHFLPCRDILAKLV